MGFDRAEFLDNLKAITGVSTATFPAMRMHFAALEEVAVNAIHEIAKKQELEDLFKGMRDGGNVLTGGRQRRNGQNEFSALELVSGLDAYDSVLLQSTMDSLNELRAIDEALAANWAERMELAEKYLDSEVLQRRPGETPEQYQQRITEALKEKQADMLPEDAARLDDNLAEENILKRNREALIQELKERQNQYDIVNMLAMRQQELAANLQNIDTRLSDNGRLRSRVGNLRSRNSSEAEAEIADILEERSDLNIEIPEGATTEEKIHIVETAISRQSSDLEDLKATTEVELVEVERDQQMLSENVLSEDEQMAVTRANNNALDGAGQDKDQFMSDLKVGFTLAMNAEEPLVPRNEQPAEHNQQNPSADLNINPDFS